MGARHEKYQSLNFNTRTLFVCKISFHNHNHNTKKKSGQNLVASKMALGILTKKCETLLASSFTATDFSHLSNGFKELDGYGPAAGAAMSTSFLNYSTNATRKTLHQENSIPATTR